MARISRQNRILYLSIQTLIEANISILGAMTRATTINVSEWIQTLLDRRAEIEALLVENPPPGLRDGPDDDDD